MNTEIKWAQVAHYYPKAPIQTVYDGDDFKGDLPHLRHRDDITEAEAREFMNGFALFDWEEAKGLPHGYESAKQWFIEYFSDDFITPAQTLWLLNRGFDLFGLIESGQAIRKS